MKTEYEMDLLRVLNERKNSDSLRSTTSSDHDQVAQIEEANEKAAFYRELSAKLMSQVHSLVYELGEARRQLRHEKERSEQLSSVARAQNEML